jgi:hypothetical protein
MEWMDGYAHRSRSPAFSMQDHFDVEGRAAVIHALRAAGLNTGDSEQHLLDESPLLEVLPAVSKKTSEPGVRILPPPAATKIKVQPPSPAIGPLTCIYLVTRAGFEPALPP